jgi:acetate kinase
MKVLVLNGGSTGLKAVLFAPPEAPHRLAVTTSGRAGLDGLDVDWASLDGVGHRVVHGGDRHQQPVRVTPRLLDDLRALAPFDPNHLPAEIALMEEVARRRPELPQVACFDTAFHATLPPVARLLPLPRRLHDQGIRRYGFHGLSYQWISGEVRRRWGETRRLVIAHLGGGASLAALRDGISVDTTMGFSPTAGVPMATRSGDVDPGVLAFLARSEGMSAEAFVRMCNQESGLLGVSGLSGDLRVLADSADPRAREAIALFCYEVKKRIGAFAAVLGGLDRLVFTGGIGEHSAPVRAAICDGLGFLGVAVDPARNAAHALTISPDGAAASVHVIPTDEEQVVHDGVLAVLGQERRS